MERKRSVVGATPRLCLVCNNHQVLPAGLRHPSVPLLEIFAECMAIEIPPVAVNQDDYDRISFCCKCKTDLEDWKQNHDQEIRAGLKARRLKATLAARLLEWTAGNEDEDEDNKSGMKIMERIRSQVRNHYNVSVRLKRFTAEAKIPKNAAPLTSVEKEIQNYEGHRKDLSSPAATLECIVDNQEPIIVEELSQGLDSQNLAETRHPGGGQLTSLNQRHAKVTTTGYGIKGGQLICQICSETFEGSGAILRIRNHVKNIHKEQHTERPCVEQAPDRSPAKSKSPSTSLHTSEQYEIIDLSPKKAEVFASAESPDLEQLLDATERLMSEQGIVRRIPVIKFCENTNISEVMEENEKSLQPSSEVPSMMTETEATNHEEHMQVDCSIIDDDEHSVSDSCSQGSSSDLQESTECPIIGSLQYDVFGITVTLKEGKYICGACQRCFSGRWAKPVCMKHVWGVHAGLLSTRKTVSQIREGQFLYCNKIPFSVSGNFYRCGICGAERSNKAAVLILHHFLKTHRELIIHAHSDGSVAHGRAT